MPTDIYHDYVPPAADAYLLALAAQLVAKIADMPRTPTAARKEDGCGEAASA